jgi:hypothetical protein
LRNSTGRRGRTIFSRVRRYRLRHARRSALKSYNIRLNRAALGSLNRCVGRLGYWRSSGRRDWPGIHKRQIVASVVELQAPGEPFCQQITGQHRFNAAHDLVGLSHLNQSRARHRAHQTRQQHRVGIEGGLFLCRHNVVRHQNLRRGPSRLRDGGMRSLPRIEHSFAL